MNKKLLLTCLLLSSSFLITGCGIKKNDLSMEIKSYWKYDENKGIEQCDAIKNDDKLKTHYNFCVENVATAAKDPNICYKIDQSLAASPEQEDFTDGCIYNIALNSRTGDAYINLSDWCGKLSDLYSRKDNCYQSYAKILPNVCDYMSSQDQKGLCYTTVAQQQNDSKLCNKISSQQQKTFCINLFK